MWIIDQHRVLYVLPSEQMKYKVYGGNLNLTYITQYMLIYYG